jgi:transportin-3
MSDNRIDLANITYENFLQAVYMLYKNNDSDIKNMANSYLYRFEESSEAWDISVKVLNTSGLNEEAYYNASQIIKKKLRYDFSEHANNEIVLSNLANFLIDKVYSYKDHMLYLLSNICKCFSLLSIFAHKKFPEIIKKLVQNINNDDMRSLMSLLLIFNYMPENIINKNEMVIDDEYKTSYESFLSNIAEDVIIFLNFLIDKINNNKNELIKNDPNMVSFFRLMNKNVYIL